MQVVAELHASAPVSLYIHFPDASGMKLSLHILAWYSMTDNEKW